MVDLFDYSNPLGSMPDASRFIQIVHRPAPGRGPKPGPSPQARQVAQEVRRRQDPRVMAQAQARAQRRRGAFGAPAMADASNRQGFQAEGGYQGPAVGDVEQGATAPKQFPTTAAVVGVLAGATAISLLAWAILREPTPKER